MQNRFVHLRLQRQSFAPADAGASQPKQITHFLHNYLPLPSCAWLDASVARLPAIVC